MLYGLFLGLQGDVESGGGVFDVIIVDVGDFPRVVRGGEFDLRYHMVCGFRRAGYRLQVIFLRIGVANVVRRWQKFSSIFYRTFRKIFCEDFILWTRTVRFRF